MDEWQTDFATAQARLPWWLAKRLRPRLVFLPSWWRLASNGAWAWLHIIFVGPHLGHTSTVARRYLIGHEYGHIRSNHTIPSFLFLCAILVFSVGRACHWPVVEAWSWLIAAIMGVLHVRLSSWRRCEYQADSVAASLYGQETALQGMLWMSYKTATFDKARRERLTRLGWQEQD